MGQVESDIGCGPALCGDGGWIEVTVSRGDPAAHSGFAIGSVDSIPSHQRYLRLLAASLGTASEFEAEIVSLPTVYAGPFPGVVTATWWAALPAITRARLQAALALRAMRAG